MNVEQVHTSIRCVTRSLSAFLLASFRVLKKLLVLMAVPRAGGKMKAPGLVSLTAEHAEI